MPKSKQANDLSSDIKATESYSDGDRWAKDALVDDAVQVQRERGQLPTPEEWGTYFAGMLEGLDHKQKHNAPGYSDGATEPPVRKPKSSAMQREFERRGGSAGTFHEWQVTRKDATVTRVVDRRADEYCRKLGARVRLLMNHPEYSSRMRNLVGSQMADSIDGEEAKRRTMEIVNESNKRFGHWLNEKPVRLWFH